jgi:hypothetical protein
MEHVYKMLLDGSQGFKAGTFAGGFDDQEYRDALVTLREPNWVVISNPTFAAPDFTLQRWQDATPYNNRYVRNEPA